MLLDVFDQELAESYLVRRAGKPDERLAARALAEELGGLPLALSHAAIYCSEATSFDNYLHLLRNLPATELFDSPPDVMYRQSLASIWRVSIQAATAEAPLAADALSM